MVEKRFKKGVALLGGAMMLFNLALPGITMAEGKTPVVEYEVSFSKTPSDLTLEVIKGDVPDECKDPTAMLACVLELDTCPAVCKAVYDTEPISPQEDGKYKLAAGTYSYTATKDGYTPKENILFKVTSEGASHNVEVTLEVISQNFYTSNDNSFPVVLS